MLTHWTPVVAVALRRADGLWLMHQRPPGKMHGGLWEFPGGKVELHESPAQALVREAHEELAITLSAADLVPAGFAQESAASTGKPIIILLFECGMWRGEPTAVEGGAVEWFTPDQIACLERPPLDIALSRDLFAKRRP